LKLNYFDLNKTFLLFALVLYSHCYTQNIIISGKVTDTLQNPLAYANILAIPSAEDQDVKFAVTENDGTYKL
jgi:hypothetical protein